MKTKGSVRWLCEMAMIAALYCVLTVVLSFMSFGPIQCRVSEGLCVLPYFTSASVPGLFIGCLLANAFGTPIGILDIVLGSAATLASALVASKIKIRWLVPLPSVLFNAFLVPVVLMRAGRAEQGYFITMLTVGAGQAIACYGVGMPLMLVFEKYKHKLFCEQRLGAGK